MQLIIFLVGGIVAGSINTLAGYGSIITLSLLMELGGLTPNMANGTNRVGILANSIAGVVGFRQGEKIHFRRALPFIVIATIGALPGIYLATIVDNDQFRNVFRILAVSLFFFTLTKPKKWLIAKTLVQKPNWYIIVPMFLMIGFYGGFIQFGLGLFILAALVLFNNIELIEANAIKLALIAVYSLIAIIIFHWKGMIDWKLGLVLATGQSGGAYMTAKIAAKNDSAKLWAYRILILLVCIIVFRELMMLVQEFD